MVWQPSSVTPERESKAPPGRVVRQSDTTARVRFAAGDARPEMM